jgi:hypothetical protein
MKRLVHLVHPDPLDAILLFPDEDVWCHGTRSLDAICCDSSLPFICPSLITSFLWDRPSWMATGSLQRASIAWTVVGKQ